MRILTLLFLFVSAIIHAQSYSPAAGKPGSTAIAADSELFVGWATGIEVQRGLIDITNPELEYEGDNYASYGEPEDALGAATNSAVSLGDAGEATLTFETPIGDGPGYDFAVFENSFSDTFLELAFVEVSSNGTDYFRFPSHSETQTDTQVGGFGNLDPTYLNNLAGKYRAFFGTPFDLSDLEDDPLLDKNAITHIKIIDVVGNIDPEFARYDSYGNAINDPFATPFHSGGFDLDAVGVINEQQVLSLDVVEKVAVSIYPNPTSEKLFIETQNATQWAIYDVQGRMVFSGRSDGNKTIDVSTFKNGVYVLTTASHGKKASYRFLKE